MRAQETDAHVLEARRILLADIRECLKMTPREQAEAAYCAGGPSIEELEERITARRLADGFLGS